MAVILALFAAVVFGLANYVGPRLARDVPFLLMLVVAQSFALVLALVVVLAQDAPPPTTGAAAWALLAGAGNGGGMIFLYKAVAIGPLSIVSPIGSLGVAIPLGVGLATGEKLTAAQAAGLSLAIAGLVLVTRRPVSAGPLPTGGAPPDGPHEFDRLRVVGLSLLSAIGLGVFLTAVRPAAEEGAAWAVLLTRVSVMVALLVLASRARVFTGARERRLARLTIPGILLFAGTLAYASATRRGDLVTVSVLGALFPVVTVALALTLDRERLTRAAGAGVAAAIAGVALLSTSV